VLTSHDSKLRLSRLCSNNCRNGSVELAKTPYQAGSGDRRRRLTLLQPKPTLQTIQPLMVTIQRYRNEPTHTRHPARPPAGLQASSRPLLFLKALTPTPTDSRARTASTRYPPDPHQVQVLVLGRAAHPHFHLACHSQPSPSQCLRTSTTKGSHLPISQR
jgi:hypothetical protein